MKMCAAIVCEYESENISKAVADALRPDNSLAPKGIKIMTKARGKRVMNVVKLEGKIETLLATLDDLLACISAAEEVLEGILSVISPKKT